MVVAEEMVVTGKEDEEEAEELLVMAVVEKEGEAKMGVVREKVEKAQEEVVVIY